MKRLRSKLLLACTSILLFGSSHVGLADNCADAEFVGDVTNLRFDTRGTTEDGIDPYILGPNIWYRYAATCTGDVTVSLMGSDYNTKLAVYSGSKCYPGADDVVARNDNYNMLMQSQVTFVAIAGDEFLIEIGGKNEAVGEGLLTISCDGEPGAPPSRDDCSKALPIGDVNDMPFDTAAKTFDGPGLCLTSPNIWYCYTASCTGDVTVSLSGSAYDTMLAVYDGCECYPASADLIACDDDSGLDRASEITFAAVAGNQYLIEVGGYGSETGQGVLNVSCQATAASKDDCVGAEPLGDAKNLPFSTTGKTFDGPGLCLASPNIWYCYTATCTGDVTVSLLGSAYDTMLAVYKDCECYPTDGDLIACNDDFGSAYQSQVTFVAVTGGKYLIEIGGYGSETGDGILNVSCQGGTSGDVKPDLGDAPDSTNNFGNAMVAYSSVTAHFPTVYDDGSGAGPYGPVHLNATAVAVLGRQVSGESEADTGPDDDSTNNLLPFQNSPNLDWADDSVGMPDVPLSLPNCGWTQFEYEVTVIDPSVDLWVNVWFDFNRDGDWDDIVDCPDGRSVPEWAVQNQFLYNLPVGLNKITTPGFMSVHPKDASERIWMRITLAEQPWTGGSNPGELGNAGSGPVEKYQIGETEDYRFFPEVPASTECPLCEDFNGDGVIDMDDLADLTAEWLANCL